ncbi:hypothetical protein CBS101457_004594 [Exobasidium rhododendri]|nr:hypothetical protein CBS101457_004594 [Exobasidium rhododendri]
MSTTPLESASTPIASRPRHHARSFSTEIDLSTPSTQTSTAVNVASDSATPKSYPGKASTSVASTSNIHRDSPSIVINEARSPPPDAVTLPMRAKKSSPPLPSPMEQTSGTFKVASSISPKVQSFSSPSKSKALPLNDVSLEERQELDRVALLKQQQANRRPRIARLTPALSSLPIRLKEATPLQKSASQDSNSTLQFPAQEALPEQDPGSGLQIDLNCIPSPSIHDLQGAITTSHLDSMIRDRNGNPIKPSLKSPRSSVSHFMPGRTTRSDSTPALPVNFRNSKSVPTTPTIAKAVHFDSHLEHVKVFKFKQKPAAVSRDCSPEQTETETEEEKDQFPYIWRKNQSGGAHSPAGNATFSPLPQSSSTRSHHTASMPAEVEEQLVLRLPNFPSSTRVSVDREIFLERIFLADDLRSVKGTVQVRNMSFEKWVAIRYTLDHWATIGEVSAEYSETVKGGQADRFTFSIKLNELLNWPRGSSAFETKSMFMCLRYTVNETEYWDNNEGLNYQLDFRKRQVPTTPLSTATAAAVPGAEVAAAPSAVTTAATGVIPPRINLPLSAPSSSLSASSSSSSTNGRSKVFELARKGGVGGSGVFAMEDLKRELDKLRSDEEDERHSIIAPRTFASEMAKKVGNSPPISPGGTNSRSSSPSASPWTARYDFGQSLRNPKSGSRNSGSGRAAALDYFSAKPMTRNTHHSNQTLHSPEKVRPGSSAASMAFHSPEKKDQASFLAQPSPDFRHKFSMISPGLENYTVEHRPYFTDSATPSSNASPLPTPVPVEDSSRLHVSSSHDDQFHAFSPLRNGLTTPTLDSFGTQMSPAFYTPLEGSSPAALTIEQLQAVRDDARTAFVHSSLKSEKEDVHGTLIEDYSPSASPSSDYDSLNVFSPSDSTSSVESAATVSQATPPEDRPQKSRTVDIPSHARRMPSDATDRDSKALSAATTVASSSAASASSLLPKDRTSFTPASSSQFAIDQSSMEEADRLRPASMSDYQELVNRYCWNSDVLPSGNSVMQEKSTKKKNTSSLLAATSQHYSTVVPVPTSNHSSGASTPTLCSTQE